MEKIHKRVYAWTLLAFYAVLAGCLSNNPPAADAGDDQTVDGFSAITLDGSGSSDPNGDSLRYEWKLVGKPATSTVELNRSTVITPTFIPDSAGDFEFGLVVDDGSSRSEADRVTIHITGLHADAGHDQIVELARPVELDGSHSRTLDGEAFEYQWAFVIRPKGSLAPFSNANSATPTFIPDKAGLFVLELVVKADKRKSLASLVRLRTSTLAANAGADVSVPVNTVVRVDGGRSTSATGGPLNYAWDLLSQPVTSKATIVNSNRVQANLMPDLPGKYVVRLTVRKDGDSSTAQVVITADGVTTGGPSHGQHIKPPSHILSTDECLNCHNATGPWIPVRTVDHTQVIGDCVACHNGVVTVGKPVNHIRTTDRCAACHAVSQFSPVVRVDHAEVIGLCFDCHDGTTAKGKLPSHNSADNACGQCHSTVNWGTVGGDHAFLRGGCVACHEGTIARGKDVTHYATSDRCEACHGIDYWSPIAHFIHEESQMPCDTCHNGTVMRGKGLFHILVTNRCEKCHSTTAFLPQIRLDHDEVLGTCSSCHDGKSATTKPANHVVTNAECSVCHSKIAWTPTLPLPTLAPAAAQK